MLTCLSLVFSALRVYAVSSGGRAIALAVLIIGIIPAVINLVRVSRAHDPQPTTLRPPYLDSIPRCSSRTLMLVSTDSARAHASTPSKQQTRTFVDYDCYPEVLIVYDSCKRLQISGIMDREGMTGSALYRS